jgi:hypothetical protein
MASPHWQDEPEAHDFPAALDYLGLLFRPAEAAKLVDRLRGAETVAKKAKDILRASRLPLLPADDPNVAKDLAKVRDGKKLSPVLLVHGRAAKGVPLTIADGYHRICASYHVDEDEEVACRLVEPR